MNNAALLSPADIRVIRGYVQTKYARLTGDKQAEIVAEAVKTTVQRRMPQLPSDLQSQLADKLIRRCLVAEQRPILPTDVLDACASIILPDPQLKALVAGSILRWLQEHEPGQWDEDKLAARMGESFGTQQSVTGKEVKKKILNTYPKKRDTYPEKQAISGNEGNVGRTAQETASDASGRAELAADSASAISESIGSESAVAKQASARLASGEEGRSMVAFAGVELASVQRRFAGVAAVPKFVWALAIMLLFGGITAAAMAERQPAPVQAVQSAAPSILPEPQVVSAPPPDIGMPSHMRYQDIDKEAIQTYLISRDSMLADEPYFSAIVDSGREHDVHPLLLFAITGQEQGFVPKTSKHAERMANNPFNVFHSWERFNTNIHESADIAARTVSRQGAKRPEGFEPFDWLNETYAEDPNWANGVRLIFQKLTSLGLDSVQAMSDHN